MINNKIFIGLTILAAAFTACNQNGKNKARQSAQVQDSTKSAAIEPVLKNINTAQVYKHYIHLKDALVASNVAEAKKASKELANALAKIDGCESTAHLATNIANSSELKKQREDFTPLSSDIIALMKHTEIISGTLYVQYCPMANDGKGAYWLASDRVIKNPFYGDEMLNCGEVKEEIKKK